MKSETASPLTEARRAPDVLREVARAIWEAKVRKREEAGPFLPGKHSPSVETFANLQADEDPERDMEARCSRILIAYLSLRGADSFASISLDLCGLRLPFLMETLLLFGRDRAIKLAEGASEETLEEWLDDDPEGDSGPAWASPGALGQAWRAMVEPDALIEALHYVWCHVRDGYKRPDRESEAWRLVREAVYYRPSEEWGISSEERGSLSSDVMQEAFRLLDEEAERGDEPEFRHPLAPLVGQWQADGPFHAKPERRRSGIIPAPFAQRFKVVPSVGTLPAGLFANHLPVPAVPGPADPAQAYLPGLEPDGPRGTPGMLLSLLDAAGHASYRRGQSSAPVVPRVYVEGILSVRTENRDGRLHEIPVTIREIVEDWLQWKTYSPGKAQTGQVLRDALESLAHRRVPIGKHGGFYHPLMLSGVDDWRRKGRVILAARIPSAGRVGPAVDRDLLRRLGAESVIAWRAYLSLVFQWDSYGASTNKQGGIGQRHRLILPARPEVLRNGEGALIEQLRDTEGRLVFDQGGRPVGDPARPILDKGKPVKAWTNARAVRTGQREPNPERDRYPLLDAADLVAMAFPAHVITKGNRHKYEERARRAFVRIEKGGGCTIERYGHNPRNGFLPWRVMPADSEFEGKVRRHVES